MRSYEKIVFSGKPGQKKLQKVKKASRIRKDWKIPTKGKDRKGKDPRPNPLGVLRLP